MKQHILTLLIIINIFACSSDNQLKEQILDDSTYYKQVNKELQFERGLLEKTLTKDSVANIDKARLLLLIDTLQKDLGSANLELMKMIEIEHKLKIAEISNKKLIDRIIKLNSEIDQLNESNIAMSDSLKNNQIRIYRITSENNELKKHIKFKIAKVQIKAYHKIHVGILRKPNFVETKLAKEAKYIEVTFTVVANDKIEKTIYSLDVTMSFLNFPGMTKQYKINFTGEEQQGPIVRFEDKLEFQPGFHHIKISLGKEIIGSGVIELK